MSKFKIGDRVRRKKGCGGHGDVPEGGTFIITAVNNSTAESGACNPNNQNPWRHSLTSLELVVEQITNTYPIY